MATGVLLRVALPRPLLVGMLGCSLLGIPHGHARARPGVGLLVVASFAAGIGLEVFGMGWNLAMQENIDEGQLSRAYSYDALGSFVAMPVGQLLYGPLGDRFGYAPVVAISGVAYVAVALSVLLSRSVRTLPRAARSDAVGSLDPSSLP